MLCDTPPGGKTAVRLNIDMGGAPVCDVCVINSRQADIELMKTFIPPFEEPNEVVPGVLYIGSKASQVNLEKLQSYGIKRVLICCDVLRAYHKPDTDILYHRLPIKDSLV